MDNKINLSNIKKRVFSLKPKKSDGLIFQVNEIISSIQKQLVRFVYASFNKNCNLLAAGDIIGNIFVIDIIQNKFWQLPTRHLCTVLKISAYSYCTDLLIGITSGKVLVVDIESGELKDELVGHSQTVKNITFTYDRICLTVSEREAILWDLQNNGKLQVLSVEHDSSLKLAAFLPVTNNILVCFNDDTVTVWQYGTYEVVKQILPSSHNKQTIKSIAFTRNGRAVVFSGHSSQLTVFSLDTWTILRIIVLPDFILSVRKIEFLTHLFDGGCNRTLAILSGNGILYFYDMEQMVIISQLSTEDEIIKFDCTFDGKHILCILRSGEINMYRVQYAQFYNKINTTKGKYKMTKNVISPGKNTAVVTVRKQIEKILDIDKLRSILKEFGGYPDSYRLLIWTQLLQLPNNQHQYNHFINNVAHPAFDNIATEYPLENKNALKNLRKLLHNLVTWSPFFSQISYLPVFVFPFVKVFQNEPVLCFEAVCTIIINWCQHWFEYFPLPPLNILAIIENIILENSPDLLRHLTYINITTKDYAWPLLESAFSEVLSTREWCVLWDHILTNESAFLLMAVVAYSILHCDTLLLMKKAADVEAFVHTQNVINIKRLINKTYMLLNNISEHNHPRRYLRQFKKLEVGSYLAFHEYPKVLFNLEYTELQNLQKEQEHIRKDESDIMKETEIVEKYLENDVVQEIEDKRLAELEKMCLHKIEAERHRVANDRRRLVCLRQHLHQKEIDVLNKSREKSAIKDSQQKQRVLENILNDVELSRTIQETEVAKAESELLKHYSQLLLHKLKIEKMPNNKQFLSSAGFEFQELKQQQQQLIEELKKVQTDSISHEYVKQLSIVTSIAATDDLILRIEEELVQQMAEETKSSSKKLADKRVLKLEAETKELEMEVSTLLNTLSKLKASETKSFLNKFTDKRNITGQMPESYKSKIFQVIPLQQDFRRLKDIIKESRSYVHSNVDNNAISE